MRIEISDGVIWRDLGGDVVILNVETGVYFGLDGLSEEPRTSRGPYCTAIRNGRITQ
jgi:hypothetical protein